MITLILEGITPAAVCILLFGAKLTALEKEMVAFAQLLWGVPSGGLLLNVHASTPSTPFQVFWPPTNWDLEFLVRWKQQSMPRGCICTTYPLTEPLLKRILRTHSRVSDEIRCFVQSRGSFQNYCLMFTQPTILSQCCCEAKLTSSELRAYNKETLLALYSSACQSMSLPLV